MKMGKWAVNRQANPQVGQHQNEPVNAEQEDIQNKEQVREPERDECNGIQFVNNLINLVKSSNVVDVWKQKKARIPATP